MGKLEIENCDHIMAHGNEIKWDGFLKNSELPDAITLIKRDIKKWCENPQADKNIKVYLSSFTTDIQFLKYELTILKFCPNCGKENNFYKYS